MKITSLNAVSNKAGRIVSEVFYRREDTVKPRRPAKAARSERRGALRQILEQLMESA